MCCPAPVAALLLNGSTVACPGELVHFVCHGNSTQLHWSSLQYIGPSGVRIEFSGALDSIGTTRRAENAVATLVDINGDNVIRSELVITASLDFPNASIECGDGNQSVTSVLQVFGMLSILIFIYS